MIKIPEKQHSVSVGYQALIDMYRLAVMPIARESFVLVVGTPHTLIEDGKEILFYSKRYQLKDPHDPFAHLEFALKHEGVELQVLTSLFRKLDKEQLIRYLKGKVTAICARKLWFLYEFLMNEELPIASLKAGAYIPLLDSKKYYTMKGTKSPRHKILNNLLGNSSFCPSVRRTPQLEKYIHLDLSKKGYTLLRSFDPSVIGRAVHYLYMKETMSSFEIERERPNLSRAQKFIELLQQVNRLPSIDKSHLISWQNSIVDSRFADHDYRDFQNYIGIEARLDRYGCQIEYIPPQASDVNSLMEGLLNCLHRLLKEEIHPVIAAAIIAFEFVFIHPFGDGNGRIHRLLIHYILSITAFVPTATIFPISAAILKDIRKYDSVLESFSRPLMKLIPHYELDEQGEMNVTGETALYYRFVDFTLIAEYLFDCVETTIQEDFKKELEYIASYDEIKRQIQNIVDMPDQKINLFIQCVMQNNGTLSSKKRDSLFSMLTDTEIHQMEESIKKVMHL